MQNQSTTSEATQRPAAEPGPETVSRARVLATSVPVRFVAPVAERARLLRQGLRGSFRLHAHDDEPPTGGRLLGMAAWAAACVFAGMIPAGRLVVAIAFGGPAWYPFVAVALGVIGLTLITGAFAAIHRPVLPWRLLAGATAALLVNVLLVYLVF